ncbi:hypothetical protein [Paraburkholderia sacchari]|uniref:hypothetical protein n=1 Tax=Paraburkholderia sacchari TaxID=159450 RepID=UPI0005432B03|nr:hypothetical protein [Paraburkholderia sacchari]NLP64839.1 acetyltransferase [Paraburkholderia sacchari]
MKKIYAFNGDADGLCALQQLRLASGPEQAEFVTGVKRDIKLLERVRAAAGDSVTALDISMDSNRAGLLRLLDVGAKVTYFDHHHAGEIPVHDGLTSHIDLSVDVCTSILVDRFLGGRFSAWAVTAAFGDGLPAVGRAMGTAAGFEDAKLASLETLGICLNYNAYGESVSDLHFDPAELAEQIRPYDDPLDFVVDSSAYERLVQGYRADMESARGVGVTREAPGAMIVILPDEAWARRAIGVLANELMHGSPESAISILSVKSGGGYTASVRVPRRSAVGADEFCREFPTGGGRRGAGGINHLPESDFDRFAARFETTFSVR